MALHYTLCSTQNSIYHCAGWSVSAFHTLVTQKERVTIEEWPLLTGL
ncbi:rCG30536 [Rattus norvegicus]|uniref:RCG30536 n=1 Tax=Rattus norvegicus TaxID=10116 RepID=A6KN26_RAT|nr:rCG30536 [Rattus norvegicus]